MRRPLQALVTGVAQGILAHERAFQQIADAHDGTRASGTPGYGASADYVASKLVNAGYEVSRQVFQYDQFVETADPVLEQTSPQPTTYTPGEDFLTMTYSGAGDVTAHRAARHPLRSSAQAGRPGQPPAPAD
ncbi:MAG: hypothetical protein ACRDN9_10705 [Streptosporangiaceae bacterium]